MIVLVVLFLDFGEVAGDDVFPVLNLAQDVEEEDGEVFVEVFVVEEQLGEVAQVLAVDRVLGPVDFEHRDLLLFVPVDLVAGGVVQQTGLAVPLEFLLQGEEREAELAEVEAVDVMVEGGERTVVPGLGLVLAHLDVVDGLQLRDLLVN